MTETAVCKWCNADLIKIPGIPEWQAPSITPWTFVCPERKQGGGSGHEPAEPSPAVPQAQTVPIPEDLRPFCLDCNSVGMSHCAHPEDCGNVVTPINNVRLDDLASADYAEIEELNALAKEVIHWRLYSRKRIERIARAEATIEAKEKEIECLQGQIVSGDGSCDHCGKVPSIVMPTSLCDECRDGVKRAEHAEATIAEFREMAGELVRIGEKDDWPRWDYWLPKLRAVTTGKES